jgi:hypothetical protein
MCGGSRVRATTSLSSITVIRRQRRSRFTGKKEGSYVFGLRQPITASAMPE